MTDGQDDPDRRYSVEEYKEMLKEAGALPKAKRRRSSAPRRKISDEKEDSIGKRILRLMTPRILSSRIRVKKEEALAIAFANALRALTIEGRLRCVWTHPANEVAGQQTNKAQIRYAIAKAMGLIDGTADYLFLWSDGSGALEAKVGSNGQQPNQIDFEQWCLSKNVKYSTFTSVEEGIAILESWNVISPKAD